jgi:hypothetical protein
MLRTQTTIVARHGIGVKECGASREGGEERMKKDEFTDAGSVRSL